MLPSRPSRARATPARRGNMRSLVWQAVLEGQDALQLEQGAGLGSLCCHHFAALSAGPTPLQWIHDACSARWRRLSLRGRAGGPGHVGPSLPGAPEAPAALQQTPGGWPISLVPEGRKGTALRLQHGGSAPAGMLVLLSATTP